MSLEVVEVTLMAAVVVEILTVDTVDLVVVARAQGLDGLD
jgi:hypothetical protein